MATSKHANDLWTTGVVFENPRSATGVLFRNWLFLAFKVAFIPLFQGFI